MELADYRKILDDIDQEFLTLFLQRMDVVSQIADYKKRSGLAILDAQRENQKIKALTDNLPSQIAPYAQSLFKALFHISRDYQHNLISDSIAPGEEV